MANNKAIRCSNLNSVVYTNMNISYGESERAYRLLMLGTASVNNLKELIIHTHWGVCINFKGVDIRLRTTGQQQVKLNGGQA